MRVSAFGNPLYPPPVIDAKLDLSHTAFPMAERTITADIVIT